MGNRFESGVRFGVLGPLLAWRGDERLGLGPVRQRLVLAVLLIHANRRIGRAQLIDAVWGETAPAYAVNLLQKHIWRLRRTIEPARLPGAAAQSLTWTDAGYQLSVPDGGLDLGEFDALTERARDARSAGDLRRAADLLHRALALWRGPAYDGLPGTLVEAERDRLADRRAAVTENRIDVDLALGGHAELLPELRRLVGRHPLRERLHGLLMLALYRSGRQAEALTAFAEARRLLREELGVGPGPALVRLHQQMLAGDSRLNQPAAVVAPRSPPRRPSPGLAPAQLPRALPDFTGRTVELARLTALLDQNSAGGAGAPIAIIAGTAGVGKTALAVHWAHQVRDRFPHGQLYVNLRGFDPTGAATETAEAIRGFLDALGVPAQWVPATTESQAALYRSVLADRQVLVVLDNARDAEQVRPLLPGGPSCPVVVTSRNELPGLVAVDGAQPFIIDLLSAQDARRLLASRLGPDRTAAEPGAVDDIIDSCARLPLALSIAAARAASHPSFALSVLAGQLRAECGRLDAFDAGDSTTDIRAVFSWSYRALRPGAARLFRLLGLHPGPDVTVSAAASLAGVSPIPAHRALGELARAHLVIERAPGRYAFHDLLRSYACELVNEQDPPDDRRAAFGRLLDHCLHTAARAHHLLNPHHDDPIELPPVEPGAVVEQTTGPAHARSWFGAERRTLLAVLHATGDHGFGARTWQLAWAISPFLEYQGYWHEWRAALQACHPTDTPKCRALIARFLGRAGVRLGRFDESDLHLHRALALYTELGDPAGQAHTHRDLCWKLDRQGRPREALRHAELALDHFQEARHRTGQGRALNAIGWCHIVLGDLSQALSRCQEALAVQSEVGDRYGQAETWDSLGYLHRHLGQTREAIDCYQRAIRLYREFDDRFNEADTLAHLGDAHHSAGELAAAERAWGDALTMLDRLGHPEVDQLREKLRGLRDTPPAGRNHPDPSALTPAG